MRIRALAFDEGTEYEKRIHLFFIVNIFYVTRVTLSISFFSTTRTHGARGIERHKERNNMTLKGFTANYRLQRALDER
jgi:hypothetical protein